MLTLYLFLLMCTETRTPPPNFSRTTLPACGVGRVRQLAFGGDIFASTCCENIICRGSYINSKESLSGGTIPPPLPAPYTEHCVVGETNYYPPPSDTALLRATVNLNLPPEERWTELVQKYDVEIKDLLGVIKNLSFSFFQGKLIHWVDTHMNKWDDLFPAPYREELKGISQVTNIPLGELVLYNVFHEISSLCTAILGQDANGKLFHARNMDFGIFTGWDYKTHDWSVSEAIRRLQTHVTFTKDGQYLYEGVVFPGFIGQFSSMKRGLFSLTLNSRHTTKGGWLGLIKWLIGRTPIKFTTFLSREVMETAQGYEEAKTRLSSGNVTCPIYFLLGGNQTNQGCMITRGISQAEGVQDLITSQNRWYMLQTNYDQWATPLFLDNRRIPGNRCMQKLGQKNLEFEGLFNVLSSHSNFNLLTIFTHLMQVNEGRSEAYTRKCEQPCWFV